MLYGLPPTELASMAFFLLQPVGVMAEDAVHAVTRNWPLPKTVRRVVGYGWVMGFLVCTTPTWMFAVARHGPAPDMMPWPVARPLMEMLGGKE